MHISYRGISPCFVRFIPGRGKVYISVREEEFCQCFVRFIPEEYIAFSIWKERLLNVCAVYPEE